MTPSENPVSPAEQAAEPARDGEELGAGEVALIQILAAEARLRGAGLSVTLTLRIGACVRELTARIHA